MSSQAIFNTTNGEMQAISYPQKRSCRISSDDWNCYRPEIQKLYASVSLGELAKTMEQKHNFTATERQYKVHLRKWGSLVKSVPARRLDNHVEDGGRQKMPGNGVGEDSSRTSSTTCESQRSKDSGYHSIADIHHVYQSASFVHEDPPTNDSGYYSSTGRQFEFPPLNYDFDLDLYLKRWIFSRASADESDVPSSNELPSTNINIHQDRAKTLSPTPDLDQRNRSGPLAHVCEHPKPSANEHSQPDSLTTKISKANFEQQHKALERKVSDLEDMLSRAENILARERGEYMQQRLRLRYTVSALRNDLDEAIRTKTQETAELRRQNNVLKDHVRNIERQQREDLILSLKPNMCSGNSGVFEPENSRNNEPPINVANHGCLSDTLPPNKSSPALSKKSWSESFTPAEGEFEDYADIDSFESSERSSMSPDVDFFNDAYQNALGRFLDWVDELYMPQLLSRFQERTSILPSEFSFRSHTTGNSSHEPLATPSDSATNSSRSTSNANQKRKFTSPNGPAGQEVQDNERILDSPIVQKKRKVKFACHFHKRDPGKFSRDRYKTCPLGFSGLNRLKEHQVYVHKLAHYCRRCKRIFKTQDQRDAHDDEDVRCERREDPTFADYLTTDKQRAALAKKKPLGVKDEDFWFEMWDQYFPGEPRPESAIQDLDPTLTAFQSFAEHETLSTIRTYNIYNPGHGLATEALAQFWQFAIYHAVANFASQQRFHSSQSLTPARTPIQSQRQQQQFNSYVSETMQSFLRTSNPAWPDIDPMVGDPTLDDFPVFDEFTIDPALL